MKLLTKDEVRFIKETGFTPTVFQCDEYMKRTYKKPYWIDSFAEAQNIAREDFNIDLEVLLDKTIGDDLDDSDSISLEETAVYLFYTFFTKAELEKLTDEEATKFLQDFRYFYGYRKWDGGNLSYVYDAIEAKEGKRVFYLQEDGNVWSTKTEEIKDNPYFGTKTILDLNSVY